MSKVRGWGDEGAAHDKRRNHDPLDQDGEGEAASTPYQATLQIDAVVAHPQGVHAALSKLDEIGAGLQSSSFPASAAL